MPKKRILKLKADLTEGYSPPPEKKRNKDYFDGIVYKLNKDVSKTNREEKKIHKYPEIYKYLSKFFTYKDVMNFEGIWLPSINHVVMSEDENNLNAPSDYKIAELGILCLINNKKSGLIFQFYPKLGNLCRVFKIDYEYNIENGQKILNETIDLIKNAELRDLKKIYNCPFGCDKCPISLVCQEFSNPLDNVEILREQ